MLRTDLIRPLPELLAEHARVRPDVIAFADAHRADDYATLARNPAALAGNLQRLGLEPGDRVLLYLDNSVDTVEAYLGVTDDIPRTGSGKILRFRLQQRLTGESS